VLLPPLLPLRFFFSAAGLTAAHEASRGSRVALLELLSNNGCNLGAASDKQVRLVQAGWNGLVRRRVEA